MLVFAGCSGPTRATEPLDENAAGHKLYVAKCTKCHKFYDPAKYSDEDWTMWMKKMSRKARLNAEQERMLSRYIEETYRATQKRGQPVSNPR